MKYRIFFCGIFLLVTNVVDSQILLTKPNGYLKVYKLQKNALYYSKYSLSDSATVSLVNIKTANDSVLFERFNNSLFNYNSNVRAIILLEGLGSLIDKTKATKKEVSYQDEAIHNKYGIWARTKKIDFVPSDTLSVNSKEKLLSPNDKYNNSVHKFWNGNWQWIISTIISIFSIGFITNYLQKLKDKIQYERTLHLLIMGEGSVGKTVLVKKLLNSDISTNDLVNTSPTESTNKIIGERRLKLGSYEVLPMITDSAGPKYSEIWDSITKRKQAIIFILSPVKTAYQAGKIISINEVDRDFVNEQLGVMKVYLGSINAQFMRNKKPLFITIFISKFDMFSESPANTPSGSLIVKSLENTFKAHIDFARREARVGTIPFNYVIGSPPSNWGISDIEKTIKKHFTK